MIVMMMRVHIHSFFSSGRHTAENTSRKYRVKRNAINTIGHRSLQTHLAELRDEHKRNVVVDEIPIRDGSRLDANVHGAAYDAQTHAQTPSSDVI